ncbi:MAG TPA: redoxin domain-containing protein [Chloroflexi bacterium]|nr:redoxin domain-containing protein [Chloroflexota bacterium]
MTESKTNMLLLMLMGIVILLMVAIIGLFLRMNQLQQAVLGALASSPPMVSEQEMGLEIGTEAPAFTLSDTNGTTVSLADFAGQKVLLAFSSIHCSACKETYSHLKAFSENRDNVQVVMISLGATRENRQLVEEQGFIFPVLTASGWNDPVMEGYKVPGTPFFYVIDREGRIVNADFGNTLEKLASLIEGSDK